MKRSTIGSQDIGKNRSRVGEKRSSHFHRDLFIVNSFFHVVKRYKLFSTRKISAVNYWYKQLFDVAMLYLKRFRFMFRSTMILFSKRTSMLRKKIRNSEIKDYKIFAAKQKCDNVIINVTSCC